MIPSPQPMSPQRGVTLLALASDARLSARRAPNMRLYVDPALHDWVRELTVRDPQVGSGWEALGMSRKSGSPESVGARTTIRRKPAPDCLKRLQLPR